MCSVDDPAHPRRTIVIGDIHGCIVEFRELIDKLAVTSSDQVICLADFMDKGPSPAETVRFARESGFQAVLGNHEEKHVRWRKHEDRRRANPGYKNPMRPLGPRASVENERLSEEDVAWLRSLPTFLRFASGWVAVHGGLFPGAPVEDQDPDDIIRARWVSAEGKAVPTDYNKPGRPPGAFHWTEVYDGTDHVVTGHEAHSLSSPLVVRHATGATCYGIDTGCVHGGRLTALVLNGENVSFTQVQARQVYDPPHTAIPE